MALVKSRPECIILDNFIARNYKRNRCLIILGIAVRLKDYLGLAYYMEFLSIRAVLAIVSHISSG